MVAGFRYINLTGSSTFDTDLGTSAVRLGSITGLVERAELGQIGSSRIDVDDPTAVWDFLGLQNFKMTESLAPSNTVFFGVIGDRIVSRGDSTRPSLVTGAERYWQIDLTDTNAYLSTRLITDVTADRPAETAAARLAWLLGLSNCRFHDYGRVVYPTHAMDATNYKGQRFGDVLASCAAAAAYNFYLYYDPAHTNIGLHFDDPNATTFSSTATISNVLADVQGGAFYILPDATLRRSASRIASGVFAPYVGGDVYVENATTADTYDYFDHAAPNSSVKTASAATTLANTYLAQSDSEDDRITCTIRVPAANVNDIVAGHRVQATFSHLPGYSTQRWFRVLARTIKADEQSDQFYKLTLELSPKSLFGSADVGWFVVGGYASLFTPLSLWASDDGSSWTQVLDAATISANVYAGNIAVVPVPPASKQHRYWSFHMNGSDPVTHTAFWGGAEFEYAHLYYNLGLSYKGPGTPGGATPGIAGDFYTSAGDMILCSGPAIGGGYTWTNVTTTADVWNMIPFTYTWTGPGNSEFDNGITRFYPRGLNFGSSVAVWSAPFTMSIYWTVSLPARS